MHERDVSPVYRPRCEGGIQGAVFIKLCVPDTFEIYSVQDDADGIRRKLLQDGVDLAFSLLFHPSVNGTEIAAEYLRIIVCLEDVLIGIAYPSSRKDQRIGNVSL